MPWGRMDDKFHRNRKVRELRRVKGGREALGTWVYWWSWCLDDPDLSGFVPSDELPPADAKVAPLLVEVGLWDEVDGGYRFHDFAEYNPTRTQIEAKKKADRERVAAKREASRENVACDNASDSPPTITRVASTRVPSPSQPIPREEEERGVSSSRLSLAREVPVESRAPWLRVLDVWVEHAHAGKSPGLARNFKAECESILKAAEARRSSDPIGLCREVIPRYIADRRAKGSEVNIRFLAKDFAGEAERKSNGNGSAPVTPELAEYRRIKAERAAALKVNDGTKVHDCELRMLEIQKGWDNARRL